jgi:hypothetical protein
MFGLDNFVPWVGQNYEQSSPRLLVLGESRYDKEFTDRAIIHALIGNKLEGHNRRTFTNFVQAAIGKHHSEEGYDLSAFWNKSLFCNYNTTFFPGEARRRLPYETRMAPRNAMMLGSVLREFRPTHAIVWGIVNWDSIDVDHFEVSGDLLIPGIDSPCWAVRMRGHETLFMCVSHPSSGFSFDRWAPMISTFLSFTRQKPE